MAGIAVSLHTQTDSYTTSLSNITTNKHLKFSWWYYDYGLPGYNVM